MRYRFTPIRVTIIESHGIQLVILAPLRLKQEDCKFKASLNYRMRPCLRSKSTATKTLDNNCCQRYGEKGMLAQC
jgi:hypothetical protein